MILFWLVSIGVWIASLQLVDLKSHVEPAWSLPLLLQQTQGERNKFHWLSVLCWADADSTLKCKILSE